MVKPIQEWTRKELEDKMKENLQRFLLHRTTKGDRLTEQEIEFDIEIKAEICRRGIKKWKQNHVLTHLS